MTGEDLANFTRQLVTMLDAGLSLAPSLDFYVSGVQKGDIKWVIDEVSSQVSSGKTMSQAMRAFPEVFSGVYVGLIQTGEGSGSLITALAKLADLTERQVKLQKKIVAAATYPVILLGVSAISSFGFIYFVLPELVPLLTSLNVQLPLPTRILLSFKVLLPWIMGLLAILIGVGWITQRQRARFFERNPALTRHLWALAFRIPMVGPTMEKVMLARVLFAITTMLEVGLSLTATLQRCENAVGNSLIAHRLRLTRADVIEGVSLSEALETHKVFPTTVIHMIRAGEESAVLSDMSARAAVLFEEDVDMALTDLTNAMEPFLMAATGIVVGFVLLSAMLPMVQLLQNLN